MNQGSTAASKGFLLRIFQDENPGQKISPDRPGNSQFFRETPYCLSVQIRTVATLIVIRLCE
jgi:hypothetical protein